MKVIILAAGIGKRLGGSSEEKPKCLLEVGDVSLLERHITLLNKFGLHDIHVVIGFQQDMMSTHLAEFGLGGNKYINPDFRLGSVISLYCAADALSSGEDIILMDADVLYAPQILQRLIETEKDNCFLLDRNFEAGEEPVKLCVNHDRLIDFRKKIDKDLEYDLQGESVGFFKFSTAMAKKLLQRLQYYMDNKLTDEPYEEAIRDLLLAEPHSFSFEDVTGLPWIEIDFPEDLLRARTDILTKIEKLEN